MSDRITDANIYNQNINAECLVSLQKQIEQLKAELAEQKKLWTLAAPELNANDDNSFAVRFMDLHDPIGRIDLVLQGGEK